LNQNKKGNIIASKNARSPKIRSPRLKPFQPNGKSAPGRNIFGGKVILNVAVAAVYLTNQRLR